jgi:hypothetical protein
MTDKDFVRLIDALMNDPQFSQQFHDPATRAAALSNLKITPTAALLNALSMVDYGIIETVRAIFEPNTTVRPFN